RHPPPPPTPPATRPSGPPPPGRVVRRRPDTPRAGDETRSRRHFEPGNSLFWRRVLFSSLFLGRKLDFLATSPFLVAVLGWKTRFFGDEPCSRRHFKPRNPIFWRRDLISSSF
ncbi:hypothetical protein, partial [Caldifermentibacillus hisashii]|uniref:hypothetical protein n=1 Tax=Caldifermentibacillus hisashii TaxID=996558 RepID=UPI002E02048E|nr:hypothetical protein [Caldifermentibacillus hisashii]